MTRRILRAFLFGALSFALTGQARADVAQWDFDGDLESTTGQEALVEGFAAPETAAVYSFESVTIGGAAADVLYYSRGTFFRVFSAMLPNGGGAYINQYTLILDVMFPDRSPSDGWACLLQTNEANANDGDWFVDPTGKLGIAGVYGDGGNPVLDGNWYRVALVVDLVAGTYTSFIDGVQVQQLTGQGLDGRFSLYSINDGANDGYSIFADETGDNSEGYVNSMQFRDVALSPADIAAMGGPTAAGIPIPSDPRDCSFRNFQVKYDRATNTVGSTWLPLAGEQGFRVFQGARQIGGNLPASATSFTDTTPPSGGRDIVYTLQPLKAGGAVERQCLSAPIDTFGCIEGLACCADQSTSDVTLTWSPAVNVAVSGYNVTRNGAPFGSAAAGDSSFIDTSVTTPGTYTYEVQVLAGGPALCSLTCRTTVTGIPVGPPGTCGGVINTYDFNGDLKSSTGGRDLIPLISAPIDLVTGSPEFSFESSDIGGKEAQVCRYSRGTIFRLFTGLGPNGGGLYTNQYTLILDVLFEGGAIDESGWAALYQTNDVNGNDGDWFVRATDRGVGIDGNYGGFVEDDVWHRLALVVDSAGGTFTSYIDGVQVQQNTGLTVDDRFTLYTTNHGDSEGISLFADNSGENSGGLVNSAQIRDIALSSEEVQAFGGPSAGGIPAGPPCPNALRCAVSQAGKSATLSWNRGFAPPGNSFTIRRNGTTIATLPITASQLNDPDLAPGIYFYELSVDDKDSGCTNLPLTCQAEVIGEHLFFEDFEAYENNNDLSLAGWEIRDINAPVENAAWTVVNPGRRANPPTFNGRPSGGRFVISDSAYGGSDSAQNTAGSGIAYELWSPSFSTLGATSVWLHFDAAAQLNNDGDAVFGVDVSNDDGTTWSELLERVSPGRALDPVPEVDDNADGLYGRVHLDLGTQAANKASVRVRFRHFEPTWDWWVAVDNVLVDKFPGDPGTVEILKREQFSAGIPAAWKIVSGPGSDSADPWSDQDPCSISLSASGGTFPDGVEGRGLHHLGNAFAMVDPICSSAKADEYLVTPALDCSGKERVFLRVSSALVVTMRAVAEILVSLDGGATFEPSALFSYNGGGLVVPDEEPFYDELVLEAPIAAGKTNVAFAFHYKSLGSLPPTGAWWAIDDVAVSGTLSQGGPVFHRGDADNNGKLELTDAVRVLNYLFTGGIVPTCLDAADADDNGKLELTDAIRILGYLFLGAAPPASPGPPPNACGPDAGGQLGCATYSHCN